MCTEFDCFALEVGCVDLQGQRNRTWYTYLKIDTTNFKCEQVARVDLNHRPVLRVAVRANSEVDRRREDNMS